MLRLIYQYNANLLAFNLGATLYFITGAVFEERKLLKAFGRTYSNYRKRTPMLVPGMRFPHRP